MVKVRDLENFIHDSVKTQNGVKNVLSLNESKRFFDYQVEHQLFNGDINYNYDKVGDLKDFTGEKYSLIEEVILEIKTHNTVIYAVYDSAKKINVRLELENKSKLYFILDNKRFDITSDGLVESSYATVTYVDTGDAKAQHDAIVAANEHSDANDTATLNSAKTYADEKDATNLASAKTYTDEKTAGALDTAKAYTDTALNTAKEYTDTALDTAKEYTDEKVTAGVTEAKTYTDTTCETTLDTAKEYTDVNGSSVLQASKEYTNTVGASTLEQAKTYVDTQGSDVLDTAKSYTDEKSSATLNSAKTYTDTTSATTLSTAKTYTDTTSATTLSTAKTYTDTTSASTLTQAKSYTDTKTATLLDDAKEYTDTKSAATLSTAETYADTQDKDTLSKSKTYTDTAISGISLPVKKEEAGYTLGGSRKSGSDIGTGSFTEGNDTTAEGAYSHAEGYYTQATQHYEHAEGSYNKSNTNTRSSIGIGTTDTDRKNAVEVTTDGKVYIYNVGGYNGTNPGATGVKDLAKALSGVDEATLNAIREWSATSWSAGSIVKYNDKVYIANNGTSSVPATEVPGTSTKWLEINLSQVVIPVVGSNGNVGYSVIGSRLADSTIGKASFTIGTNNTASGQAAYAEGGSTIASAAHSHAEGVKTTASGDFGSHAEGFNTTASGSYAHSEGESTTASGHWSHAENASTTASGQYSHAEGWHATASGDGSHAEGQYTTASGNYSHAEGYYTQTTQYYEHAEGSYNKSNTDTRSSIGIGSSDTSRVNAVEVMSNGKVYIYNVGGYNGTNPGATGVKDIASAILSGDFLPLDCSKALTGSTLTVPTSFTLGAADSLVKLELSDSKFTFFGGKTNSYLTLSSSSAKICGGAVARRIELNTTNSFITANDTTGNYLKLVNGGTTILCGGADTTHNLTISTSNIDLNIDNYSYQRLGANSYTVYAGTSSGTGSISLTNASATIDATSNYKLELSTSNTRSRIYAGNANNYIELTPSAYNLKIGTSSSTYINASLSSGSGKFSCAQYQYLQIGSTASLYASSTSYFSISDTAYIHPSASNYLTVSSAGYWKSSDDITIESSDDMFIKSGYYLKIDSKYSSYWKTSDGQLTFQAFADTANHTRIALSNSSIEMGYISSTSVWGSKLILNSTSANLSGTDVKLLTGTSGSFNTAVSVTSDRKMYVYGIGGFTGSNQSSSKDLASAIPSYTFSTGLVNTNNTITVDSTTSVTSGSSKLITSGAVYTAISGISFPVIKDGNGYSVENSRKASTTIGTYSFTEGSNHTASGSYSHAEGYGTTVSGDASHAEGTGTTASGDRGSHAEGCETTASGVRGSHAEGCGTTASGQDGSHAEGINTTALGGASHAEGRATTANDIAAHAEGNNTTASGIDSHAEGGYTQTTQYYEHAEGYYNKSNTNTRSSIGIGSSNTDRKNAVEVMTDGKVYVYNVGGYNGTNPGASGVKDLASVAASVVKDGNGYSVENSRKASTTIGTYSFTNGYNNTASGYASYAEGSGTTASGGTSSYPASHAEGYQTTASGRWGSHAEGWSTTASGYCAHAEGYTTTASGNYTHTEGQGTQATQAYEHAEGRYNKSNTNTRSSIGIGSSDTSRINAVEVMTDGKVYIKGIGSYNGTNPGASGVKDLASALPPTYTFSTGLVNSSNTITVDSTTSVTSGSSKLITSGAMYTALANKQDKLTISTGLTNSSNTITLNKATTSALGGVIVGSYLTVDSSGKISANAETTVTSGSSKLITSGAVYTAIQNAGSCNVNKDVSGSNTGYSVKGSRKSSTTIGTASFTEGSNNTASGDYGSHAEGRGTTASGSYSHAEGSSTTASGDAAHAEGSNTTAFGGAAHAEGSSTTASEGNSHAEGCGTIASGRYGSHAEGYYTKATSSYSHAEGMYNNPIDNNQTAVYTISSIGIGSSDTNRKNAFEVMRDGKVFILGIGGYNGTNPTRYIYPYPTNESKDLATVITEILNKL